MPIIKLIVYDPSLLKRGQKRRRRAAIIFQVPGSSHAEKFLTELLDSYGIEYRKGRNYAKRERDRDTTGPKGKQAPARKGNSAILRQVPRKGR